MINWVILIALIFLAYFFLTAKKMQHKFYIILVTLLIIFFYVTGTLIISKTNANLKTFDGLVTAGKTYFKWLGHAIKNVRNIIGNAIKMDWSGGI